MLNIINYSLGSSEKWGNSIKDIIMMGYAKTQAQLKKEAYKNMTVLLLHYQTLSDI